jgi:hypothetical protein
MCGKLLPSSYRVLLCVPHDAGAPELTHTMSKVYGRLAEYVPLIAWASLMLCKGALMVEAGSTWPMQTFGWHIYCCTVVAYVLLL